MTIEELKELGRTSEELQKEQSSNKFGLFGAVMAGSIAALAFNKPIAAFMKRMDFTLSSIIVERFPKMLQFTGAVQEVDGKHLIDYARAAEVLGTIQDTTGRSGSSIFLRSVADKADITGTNVILKRFMQGNDFINPKDVNRAYQAATVGALSVSGYLGYKIAAKLTGNRQESEKSFFEYELTRGLPFYLATTVFGGVLTKAGDNQYINTLRRAMVSSMEYVSAVPEKFSALSRTIREIVPRNLKSIFTDLDEVMQEAKTMYSRFKGDIEASAVGDKMLGLKQLYAVAEQSERLLKQKKFDPGDVDRIVKASVEDLYTRFKDPQSQIFEMAGLKSATVADVMETDRITDEARKTLLDFASNYNVDLTKIYAGEGVAKHAGNIKLIDTPRRFAMNMVNYAARNMQIPYLGFNPISLFQPRLFTEYSNRPALIFASGSEILPTQSGPKNVARIGMEFINERLGKTVFDIDKIGQMPEKEQRNIMGMFSLVHAGKRSLISIDMKKASLEQATQLFDYISKGETLVDIDTKLTFDITENIGEGYMLSKSSVGGSFARSVYFQTGFVDRSKLPKIKTLWQKYDLPFTSRLNVEQNFLSRFMEKARNVFGENLLKKSVRIASESGPFDSRKSFAFNKIAEIFRISTGKNVTEELLVAASELDAAKLNTFNMRRIRGTQDIMDSFIDYMSARSSMIKKAADADTLKALSPSSMEWHIFKELKGMRGSGLYETENWLSEIVTISGESRLDIIKKSTLFGILSTRKDPTEILGIAKALDYKPRLQRELQSMVDYSIAEKKAYSWAAAFASQKIPVEQILDKNLAQSMFSGIKSADTFFGSYISRLGYDQMLPNVASSNVYMFIRSTKTLGEMEGSTFRQKFGKFIAQYLPNVKDKSSTTIPGALAFYIMDRPVQLLEDIGLGRPDYDKPGMMGSLLARTKIGSKFFGEKGMLQGANAVNSLLSVVGKRILPIAAAISAASYINYQIDKHTEVDPAKVALEGFKLTLEGGAKAAEMLGFTDASEIFREYLPGLLPAIGGTLGYVSSGTMGILYGAAIGKLMENIKPARELLLENIGEKDVNVRRGRYWEMGSESFMGGKVVYNRPSLLYLAGTDWQYTDVLWGSKEEYWKYKSNLPTPENLFGLRKLLKPYYFEERNQYMRPYPVSGQSDIVEFPFIGNMLAPAGSLLKPQRSIDAETLKSGAAEVESLGYGNIPALGRIEQEAYGAYQRSEYLPYPQINYNPVLETSLQHQLKTLSEDMADYLGMLGFLGASAADYESLEESARPRVAHASLAYSTERLYYQMELGGMFGRTEYLRRIIPRSQPTYTMDYINPMPNEYFRENFSWLPKDYMTDFYRGDVYRSIGPYGEVRAPGPGYEATHKLYDNYGPLDRFLIMENIAPYSFVTQAAERRMKQNIEQYDYDERYCIQQSIENAELQRERYDFREKAFSKKLEEEEITLGSYIGHGQFALTNKAGTDSNIKVELAGINFDVDSVARKIYEREDVSIAESYAMAEANVLRLEENLRAMAGSTVKVMVPEDESERYIFKSDKDITMPVIMGNLNRSIAKGYEGMAKTDGNWMNRRAAVGDSTIGALWENVSHMNTFFHEKFFGQISAEESYDRYIAFGKKRRLWQNPVSDFLMPIMYNMGNENPAAAMLHGGYLGAMSGTNIPARAISSVIGGLFGGIFSAATPSDWVPAETRKRWETEAKFDYIQEQKNEMYGGRKQTMLGTNVARSVEHTARRLPRIEREYFEQFVNAPTERREQLLNKTAPYMRDFLEHFWSLKEQVVQSELEGEQLSPNAFNVDLSDYERYAERFAESPDWEGYNQYIDTEKLRTLYAMNNFKDYSKFEIYSSDIRSAVSTLLDTSLIYGNSYPQTTDVLATYHAINGLAAMQRGTVISRSVAPQYNGANITYVRR